MNKKVLIFGFLFLVFILLSVNDVIIQTIIPNEKTFLPIARYEIEYPDINQVEQTLTLKNVFYLEPISCQSNSMYPIISCGQKIILEKFSPNRLKIGSIILFEKKNQRIIHTVLNIDYKNKRVETQGQNNLNSDGWTSFDSIKGIAIGVLYT